MQKLYNVLPRSFLLCGVVIIQIFTKTTILQSIPALWRNFVISAIFTKDTTIQGATFGLQFEYLQHSAPRQPSGDFTPFVPFLPFLPKLSFSPKLPFSKWHPIWITSFCWFSRFSPLHAFLDKSGKLFQTMLLHPSAQYSTLIIFTLVPAHLPLVVLYYHLVSLGFHYCDLFQIPRIQQESSKHLQFIFDEFEYDREITQWNVFVTDFKRDRATCPL